MANQNSSSQVAHSELRPVSVHEDAALGAIVSSLAEALRLVETDGAEVPRHLYVKKGSESRMLQLVTEVIRLCRVYPGTLPCAAYLESQGDDATAHALRLVSLQSFKDFVFEESVSDDVPVDRLVPCFLSHVLTDICNLAINRQEH